MVDGAVVDQVGALRAQPLQNDLLFASGLFRVSRRWGVALDDRLRQAGASRAIWAALFWLSQRPGGVTQRELADEIGVETPTLTRQLDHMQALGLIERRPAPGDRRANLVVATEAAGPALERLADLASQFRRELLQDVDPDDLEATVRVLKTVGQRL